MGETNGKVPPFYDLRLWRGSPSLFVI